MKSAPVRYADIPKQNRFFSVEPSVGVTAEEDSIDMTSKKAAFFIPVIAIAALGAVAFVLRRKARK